MSAKNQSEKTSIKIILPILFGFFVMGFVDVVGIATNYVKKDFGLSDSVANLLPMMVFLWFALFSVPAGIWMGKHGQRNTVLIALVIKLLAMVVPLLIYNFVSMLVAFALLGIGNTILQVSLNPMVAGVVSPKKVTGVLTLGQFMKAVSSFLGPIIATVVASFFGNWKLIFAVYAITTLISTAWLMFVHNTEQPEKTKVSVSSILSLLKDSSLRMFFMGILCVVGIDVGLNTTIPKLMMVKLHISLQEAGPWSSLYFAARTAGTFLGAFLLSKLSVRHFLRISMVVALFGILGAMLFDNLWILGFCIVVMGLMYSNVFSILFSFALKRKPQQHGEVSALMIMGVSGGALFLPLMGIVSDAFGQTTELSLLLIGTVCIGVIAFRSKD